MILIGRFQSPFVRRVAVTLKQYGLPFEHKSISTMTDREAIKVYNPLARVPALEIDGGEILVDSVAIIDYLDELAGPAKAITPGKGVERRRVQQVVALATGACDKAVGGIYEKAKRPTEKVHQPWLDQIEGQATDGLAALERLNPSPWLVGGRMTQADVTTVCVFDFIKTACPHLAPAGKYPKLEALSQRCNALPAFSETVPKA